MVRARHKLFATCPRDLEGLLRDELVHLGASDVRATRAGVLFFGDLELAYRVCLWSRVASRVLLGIAEVGATGPDALYQGVRTIDWTAHLGIDRTFAVDVATTHKRDVPEKLRNPQFVALRVKDAIVDSMREHWGQRPSVDRSAPDVRVYVHLHGRNAEISIDLSGQSLHRRGYREAGVQAVAPVKETLAAAMLLRAGWPELAGSGAPLVDPMCGSGTLLIEAAWMAGDHAPGLLRARAPDEARAKPSTEDEDEAAPPRFGFIGWLGHDENCWRELVEQAEARAKAGRAGITDESDKMRIYGMDRDGRAISIATRCIERAGLLGLVHVQRAPVASLVPPRTGLSPGLVITNPPYGHRLAAKGGRVPDLRLTQGEFEALKSLYQHLGQRLLLGFSGWTAAVLTSDKQLGLATGLRADKRYSLYNGALACKLLMLPVVKPPPRPVFDPRAVAGIDDFINRLRKNLKRLGRWADKHEVSCYRLYDADLPEFAFAIDRYRTDAGVILHVQEYQAPNSIDERKAGRRRRAALELLPELVPDVMPERVVFKQRKRQRGAEQYRPSEQAEGRMYVVREGPCRFLVNFDRYLDTGLFLDHRVTRGWVGEWARGRDVLNLFAYTSTASVHAALGGARSTTSVDLSRTYCAWSQENFELNRLDPRRHEIVAADCLKWLGERHKSRYGLIFLDPPTFSNSRRMEGVLDLQRDAVDLIRQAATLLTRDGLLVFSCNRRGFRLDVKGLAGLQVEDVSKASIPEDFARRPQIHKCWKIHR